MNHDEFAGRVLRRAHLPSRIHAAGAIRATLQTLAECLTVEEARDLAARLPQEIATHLAVLPELHAQRFSLDEFFQRVASREAVDLPSAVYHARVVTDVLIEAVSPGEMQDVCAQLPEEFRAFVEAGQGHFMRAA